MRHTYTNTSYTRKKNYKKTFDNYYAIVAVAPLPCLTYRTIDARIFSPPNFHVRTRPYTKRRSKIYYEISKRACLECLRTVTDDQARGEKKRKTLNVESTPPAVCPSSHLSLLARVLRFDEQCQGWIAKLYILVSLVFVICTRRTYTSVFRFSYYYTR